MHIRNDVPREHLLMHVVRPGSRSHGKQQRGNPGAGLVHGAVNTAKTLTYLAIRNIDFNTERNERRAWRKLQEISNATG